MRRNNIISKALIAVFITTVAFAVPASDAADSNALKAQIASDNQQIAALNEKIASYEAELDVIGADKKTLQAAIHSLDLQRSKVEAQVAVTQRQINTTELQIKDLGGQITDMEKIIATDKGALASYIQNIHESDRQPLLIRVLTSGDLMQFWNDLNATLQVQEATRKKTQELQAKQSDLTDTQTAAQEKEDTLTSQKQSLASQQQSLTSTKKSKNQLLAQTNAKESTYEKLLAQAKAELESFSAFTQNAGGSGLLTNQTSCDAWGCYYNQRDSTWGNFPLNGTKYSLASDGCLVTSMAMVMTHYGYHGVTPVSINRNPNNFASYFPAYLLYTISVEGVTATRIAATIDATLKTGNPVVVGVHAYGGTHFVVLISGSRGNYVMRDPYIANGKDIGFSANYSLNKVFSIARVQITS